MSETASQRWQSKKDWKLNQRAFQRLLTWLDDGDESEGQTYLHMRERLVGYFDRKNCLAPDELADETLNRVTRRLDEEGGIQTDTPAKYCYTVARFVFHEYLRRAEKEGVAHNELRRQSLNQNTGSQVAAGEAEAVRSHMLDCLEKCTNKLDEINRTIILQYYVGRERLRIENRRALATELGISVNALSIRACRIRDKLEVCVRQCMIT